MGLLRPLVLRADVSRKYEVTLPQQASLIVMVMVSYGYGEKQPTANSRAPDPGSTQQYNRAS